MLDVIDLTRKLVDIPSVTGEEKDVGNFLYEFLKRQGWNCVRQQVESERFNVLATQGEPRILLTTHIDTVPPFVPSREDEKFVYGRGACDAKGIAVAMIAAAQGLREEGLDTLGLLFVVGEETDSLGALKATELGIECSYVIDGEPTDNELVSGHKGIVYARVSTEGIAAHSAYPEQGESAINKLLDVLNDLRQTRFPENSHFGQSQVNIGKIGGGRAANVLADFARSEIFIRTVEESSHYLETLNRLVDARATLEIVKISEPQEMELVEGFPVKVVGYGTDIPALRVLGRPLLFGPGSILEAHTENEKIAKEELFEAVKLYQKLVKQLRKKIPA